MNRTYLAVAATAAACAALVACSDDFLTEVPTDFVSPANFYNNAGDAIAATNAAYATFVSLPSPLSNDGYYGRNFYMVVEYPTEYVTNRLSAGNERSFFDGYSPLMTSTHAYLPTIWQSAYAGINRANSVIDRVPAVEMDETLRARLVAEAKFLRALHYYNLVGLFGGVPIRLSETVGLDDLQSGRETADSTFRVIFKDLEDAILVLPERSKYASGRSTPPPIMAVPRRAPRRRCWPRRTCRPPRPASLPAAILAPQRCCGK
jgi:starch-binding outer membrane protein, SusD/RagB family